MHTIQAIIDGESSAKLQMQDRAERLFTDLQQPNWDGYGAYPLEEKAYQNVKALIAELSGKTLSHWHLFPAPNGTFILTLKSSDIATVNIGNNEMSYAAVNGDILLKGRGEFDAVKAAKVVEEINAIFNHV